MNEAIVGFVLRFEAQGVQKPKNTVLGNERDFCLFGRGGGKVGAAA